MMDTLISTFVEESKRISDDLDGSNNTSTGDNDEAQMPLNARRDLGPSCLCNKLSKLTLATFDDDGTSGSAYLAKESFLPIKFVS